MKAPFTKPRGERPLAPAGTHVATLYKIQNLGKRIQTFQGKLKEYPDTLVHFTFELPNELHPFTKTQEDGTEKEEMLPLVVSREFVFSMGAKSNLRPFVEGIIGTRLSDEEAYAFDLEDLMGMSCLLTLVHKKSADGTRTFVDIAGASPLMKGMEKPIQVNPSKIFDVAVASLDEINALPNWIREKVIISDEYKARFGKDNEELDADSIPF